MATTWEEPYGDRQQEVVVIGVHMDRAAVRLAATVAEACQATMSYTMPMICMALCRVLQVEAALWDALLTDDEMIGGPAAWAQYADPIGADWVLPAEPTRSSGPPRSHHRAPVQAATGSASLLALADQRKA